MNSIAHIEINVKDLEISTEFWNKFISHLGWEQFGVGDPLVTGFKGLDKTHIFLVQTDQDFIENGYHRKNVGLNHFAFRVDSLEKVDLFASFLKENNIPTLYGEDPKDYSLEYGQEKYYAVFFEDPNRIKIEVVFCK